MGYSGQGACGSTGSDQRGTDWNCLEHSSHPCHAGRISLASSFIFLYANDEALAVCNVSQQVLVGHILMQIRRVLMTIK